MGMLETSALACERGGLRLFSNLGFSLAPGELLRVRGANGSGKTTLLRTLAGLTRPAAGSVRWRSRPLADDDRGKCCSSATRPRSGRVERSRNPYSADLAD
jgi:heme exporter protein A